MASEGQCRLFAGLPALISQLVLAVISFSALYIKRLRERPQRPKNIWLLDVSKQVFGMGAAHISGMLIAFVVHRQISSASECSWYAVAFTFDTTLGVLLTMLIHKAILRAIQHRNFDTISTERWQSALIDCGHYGDPPSLRRWALQATEWALCVVIARALCGAFIVLLGPILQAVATALDDLFAGHPNLLLFAVMVCCPLLMNVAQLLIQDAILKGKQIVLTLRESSKTSLDEELPLPSEERKLLTRGGGL